jgi:hypothetical protein
MNARTGGLAAESMEMGVVLRVLLLLLACIIVIVSRRHVCSLRGEEARMVGCLQSAGEGEIIYAVLRLLVERAKKVAT